MSKDDMKPKYIGHIGLANQRWKENLSGQSLPGVGGKKTTDMVISVPSLILIILLTFHCERLAVEWNTKDQLSSVSPQTDVMPENSVLHKHIL
jgi:hypothetical protein